LDRKTKVKLHSLTILEFLTGLPNESKAKREENKRKGE
jgi:hypothetical protein